MSHFLDFDLAGTGGGVKERDLDIDLDLGGTGGGELDRFDKGRCETSRDRDLDRERAAAAGDTDRDRDRDRDRDCAKHLRRSKAVPSALVNGDEHFKCLQHK